MTLGTYKLVKLRQVPRNCLFMYQGEMYTFDTFGKDGNKQIAVRKIADGTTTKLPASTEVLMEKANIEQ